MATEENKDTKKASAKADDQVTKLKKDLEIAQEYNRDITAENESLKSELQALKDSPDTSGEFEKLKEENANLKKENEELTAMQEEMAEALSSKEKEAEIKKPIGKVGKKKFIVMAGARIDGKAYSAKDLAQNEDALKKLLDKGSEILKPLN